MCETLYKDYMMQHPDANMGFCVPYQSENKRVAFHLLDIEISRLRIDGNIYDAGDAFATENIFDLDDDDAELFRRAVIAADKSLKEIVKNKENIMTALMFACKPCGCVNCPSFPCEEMEKMLRICADCGALFEGSDVDAGTL